MGSTKVVLSLAGPYALYGPPLVASALRCGTDYTDITGESEFMRTHLVQKHEQAQAKRVCLVSACGYDSVPWDLGSFLAVKELRAAGVPVSQPVSVQGLVGKTKGGFSGGTVASLLNAINDPSARGPNHSQALDPGWDTHKKTFPQAGPAYLSEARRWTLPSVMASINEKVVYRSAALAPQLYGERGSFSYKEATLAPGPIAAWLGSGALAAGLAALLFPPTRALLTATVLPKPGQGPSEELREKGYFNALCVGSAPNQTNSPRVLVRFGTRFADPGYKGTAAMCCEAALALALQRSECPGAAAGGALTPATCMGDILVERLKAKGFFATVERMEEGAPVPDM